MLDRTDFASWKQRIRLYYRGKENGMYILQSIDHGPFKLGTTRDTIGTTPEGGILLGLERPRTYDDLDDKDKKRFDADVDDQPVRDLALNDDNIFQADECDAFDSDVMMNLLLSQYSWPICPQLGQKIYKPGHLMHQSYLSNVIPYEQCLTVNEVYVVPSSASSIPNDAYVLHDNDAYVPHDPLATEINIYKEQVAIYERRANNKIIEETVTALKHEFKQKETKLLTDFSNLKKLKDKPENKLYSQDQSIQIVHMMLKPKKLYDQDAETAIGVQNTFYLRKAKKAQPALYDGDEILKTHHVPVIVTSSEEDLELAETTRIKMNEKMNDPVCGKEEVRAMKVVFENLEAEVDQNAINLKNGEIKWKNLLITNNNLIANCIAQVAFYIVTDSIMNASRFHELSTAYNVPMNRAVELKAKNSKLLENFQNDDHNTMVKDFSNL
ncbi:hypothetical protein Tco_0642137 [Tanacetum coccineum]